MGNFASFLTKATMPELSDLTKKQFSHLSEKVNPVAAQLFIQENLTSYPNDRKRYDEIDTETFAKLKREGENAAKARGSIGYNKTMIANRYATEINVSWEFRRYGETYANQVKSDLISLSHFIPQRRELDLTHIFTFANATSYTNMDGETKDLTTGDGLAVLSAVHKLAHSTTTYTNIVSGNPAFSGGALEVARNLFNTNILSNFGERRIITPNTIITSDDEVTVNSVRQLLNSTADLSAANAGVTNEQKGRYRHVVLPQLATTATGAYDSTKKRWWFLASTGKGTMGLQAYYGVFENMNLKTPEENVSNDNWVYGVRGSHGIVVVSPKGIVGSTPTS